MRVVKTLGSVALALAACGGDGGVTGPPHEVASLVLSMSETGAMTATGETRQVTARVKSADGAFLPPAAVSWSSSDTGVATVSGTGANALVTALDDGAAIITANAGELAATLTVTVRRALASIVVSAPALLAYGSSVTLAVMGRDPRGHTIAGVTGFTFSSSDPESVGVSADGVATAFFRLDAPPATTVTASATKDGLTASGAAQVATGPPAVFDHAALLLSEYELPARVPTEGQGIGAVSIFVYTRAVAALGPSATALFAAAVPCLTTLGAVPLLSERPTVTAVAGVAVVTFGMLVTARMRSGGTSTPHTANHSYPLSSQ